jgi:hypothetical protein
MATHPLESQAQPIKMSFPHKKALLETERLLSTPSDDPTGEEAGCVGPGLVWLNVVCGCEAGWTYCQIL